MQYGKHNIVRQQSTIQYGKTRHRTAAKHHAVRQNTIQYGKAQYSTAKHHTVQQSTLKNSLIIHEENTKKNHKRVVSVYVIQIHVDLHKL
jgi:hypothetical protein